MPRRTPRTSSGSPTPGSPDGTPTTSRRSRRPTRSRPDLPAARLAGSSPVEASPTATLHRTGTEDQQERAVEQIPGDVDAAVGQLATTAGDNWRIGGTGGSGTT